MPPRSELRDRLLAPSAILDEQNGFVRVDVGALVRRLILFETYILESVGLREFEGLVDVFGVEGVIALLESRALCIRLNQWYVVQTGQSDFVKPRSGTRAALPHGSFTFSTAAFIPKNYLDTSVAPSALDPFEGTRREAFDHVRAVGGAGSKANQKLREWIGAALVEPERRPLGEDVFPAMAADLTKNRALVERAVAQALEQTAGVAGAPGDLCVSVEQVHDREFKVESNLATRLNVSPDKEHRVIEQALLAVAGLNRRFDDMHVYGALSGLQPQEAALIEDKFRFVVDQVDPKAQEQRFTRVVELTGLPDASAAEKVDAERLLEVRNSHECREFRAWLRRLDTEADEEVEEQVASVGEAIARAIHGPAGRVSRFLVTAGVGVIPGAGQVLAPALSALDQFALRRVIPEPGPASFLSRSYRSIFQG
jgi:hypothetical protein